VHFYFLWIFFMRHLDVVCTSNQNYVIYFYHVTIYRMSWRNGVIVFCTCGFVLIVFVYEQMSLEWMWTFFIKRSAVYYICMLWLDFVLQFLAFSKNASYIHGFFMGLTFERGVMGFNAAYWKFFYTSLLHVPL